jgi:hypothetical protein
MKKRLVAHSGGGGLLALVFTSGAFLRKAAVIRAEVVP